MVSILDYGAGNLRSVENTLGAIGAGYKLTRDPAEVRSAEKLILPGVGHFGQMMRAVDELGLRGPILQVARSGVPFLGICLGLQALFVSSEEAPEVHGFGLFPGCVLRFPAGARVPHMGWNEVSANPKSRLLAGTGSHPYFYFAHSFYVPVMGATAARCEYQVDYTAALESENVFGVQFHPEKSGPIGLATVRNFVEL